MNNVTSIGILGAGKVGIVLAQLAVQAGYSVAIAGSSSVEKIRLTIDILVPGATAATSEDVAKMSDVVLLVLPLGKYETIPKDALAGKLVIDAMNYWWEVDGYRAELVDPDKTSSELIQEFLSESTVIKAFNHMGYHHLHDEASQTSVGSRKAIAIAGDDESGIAIVSSIVGRLGFEPVTIGPLVNGKKLQPGSAAFGANVDAATLRDLTK